MDQREETAVLERKHPPVPQRAAPGPSAEDARRARGIRDLVGGATLIGIGLLFGGSIFTGDPSLLDWIFDGLGIFWVAKGVYQIATAKPTASA